MVSSGTLENKNSNYKHCQSFTTLFILCWPWTSPQIIGTLLLVPDTLNLSTSHWDDFDGWAIERETKSSLWCIVIEVNHRFSRSHYSWILTELGKFSSFARRGYYLVLGSHHKWTVGSLLLEIASRCY